MKYVTLTTGEQVAVSDEDYELVMRWKWGKKMMTGHWYVRSTTDPRIWMPRLITKAPKSMQVDHWDRDTFNNQRSNLQVVTRSQNQQNRLGARRDSRTGIRGVTYIPHLVSPYRAYAQFQGKRYYFGHYALPQDAERAAIQGRARIMTHAQQPDTLGEKRRHTHDRQR